jgi:hypothetical protein
MSHLSLTYRDPERRVPAQKKGPARVRGAGSKPCALNNSTAAGDVSKAARDIDLSYRFVAFVFSRTSSVPHACELRPVARPRQRNVAPLSFPLGSATLRFAAVFET